MKTRQEMIYDFMIAINANADVGKAWRELELPLNTDRKYADYVLMIAEQMADKYLEKQA